MKLELLVGGILALGLLYLAKKAASAPAGTFNPASTNNIVYSAVNDALQRITGGPDSVGTLIYGAVTSETDPTKYSQADLESIVAAGNHYGAQTAGWIVG